MGRTRFAGCLTKATHTDSEYGKLNRIALTRQNLLRKGATISPLYVHCLSCIPTCYQIGIPQIEKLLSKGPAKKKYNFPLLIQ
jgi:hypothetical protein